MKRILIATAVIVGIVVGVVGGWWAVWALLNYEPACDHGGCSQLF